MTSEFSGFFPTPNPHEQLRFFLAVRLSEIGFSTIEQLPSSRPAKRQETRPEVPLAGSELPLRGDPPVLGRLDLLRRVIWMPPSALGLLDDGDAVLGFVI